MMILRVLVASAVSISMVMGEHSVLSIHGSGTTNPSKCYWHVMDKMEARAKIPVQMTFRSIGTTDSLTEFNVTPPVTHFASGDIPIKKEQYDYLTANEVIYHLPVLVSAVSFFHNIPNTPTLNLTACTLAKIFKREITAWNHSDIKSINPALKLPTGGLPIRVGRRTDGASSTTGMTSVRTPY